MKISKASDGKTEIKLDTWEEIGFRIVLPKLPARIAADDVGFSLKKIPIDVVFDEESPGAEGEPVFSVTVEPEYCQHGVLENISVEITNGDDTAAVHFNVFPPGADDDAHDIDDED